MSKFAVSISPRAWAWFFGVSSFVLPLTLFAYQHWQLSKWVGEQGGAVCGMPFLGAVLFSVALTFVCSLISLVFGLRSYAQLPRPRSRKRLFEVFSVGSACILIPVALMVAWVRDLVNHAG